MHFTSDSTMAIAREREQAHRETGNDKVTKKKGNPAA